MTALSFHHAHLMCSDVEATVDFWVRGFDAEVVRDVEFAGARNVLLRVGRGRIHLYDQRPKHVGQGTVHHLGVQTDDVHGARSRLLAFGASVTDVRSDPVAEYVMVKGPDDLLLEVFAPRKETLADLGDFFAMEPNA